MVMTIGVLPWSLNLGRNGRCHVFVRGLDWRGLPVKKVECGEIVERRPLTEERNAPSYFGVEEAH